jgi:hypothetical protein
VFIAGTNNYGGSFVAQTAFRFNQANVFAAPSTTAGFSQISPGAISVDGATVLDGLGSIKAALYNGPTVAPSGSCTAIGWVFSQDGHGTFCNGTTWVTKI